MHLFTCRLLELLGGFYAFWYILYFLSYSLAFIIKPCLTLQHLIIILNVIFRLLYLNVVCESGTWWAEYFFFFFEVVRRLEEALRKVNLMFIRAKSQCESEIWVRWRRSFHLGCLREDGGIMEPAASPRLPTFALPAACQLLTRREQKCIWPISSSSAMS